MRDRCGNFGRSCRRCAPGLRVWRCTRGRPHHRERRAARFRCRRAEGPTAGGVIARLAASAPGAPGMGTAPPFSMWSTMDLGRLSSPAEVSYLILSPASTTLKAVMRRPFLRTIVSADVGAAANDSVNAATSKTVGTAAGTLASTPANTPFPTVVCRPRAVATILTRATIPARAASKQNSSKPVSRKTGSGKACSSKPGSDVKRGISPF